MLLIIGLGNPGPEYALTRHNAGFLVVDALRNAWGGSDWKAHKESKSYTSKCQLGSEKALLVKPQTYMNRSGESVGFWHRFYKINTNNILVIHDDIDHASHRLKLKKGGSAGGQNGVKDTIEKLGTQDFWRLKCGVGRPINPKFAVRDYVLGTMKGEELAFWQESVLLFEEKIGEWRRNRE